MTQRFVLTVSVAISLLFAGLAFSPRGSIAGAPSFPKMDIKLAHVIPVETSVNKGSVKFSELMKERTGGAINVQVFPNGQLGSEKDIVEQVRNGLIHMAVIGGTFLANIDGWGAIGVFAMPYVMKTATEEEQLPVLNRMARGPILQEATAKAPGISSLRVLDPNWFYGMRHLTTGKKQVVKVDDIKGMKIRTPDAPLARLPMAALGAAVTPLSMQEVYSALQMGVVDGQENPINTIYTAKLYEVQKYITLTGHQTQNLCMIINEKFYQGLSPELKAVFDKTAMDAGDFQSDLQVKVNKENLEDMKKKGVVVNTVNRTEFAEKTKNAWKDFEGKLGKGLYEKILAAQN
ncbi:MAG: TRAP transporter substrate-binding protein [Syntrophobacteraceae bacterium]|nr:TRAP transporter substrate-binding protein [Syntrophobacteraceae bacterium]